MATRCIVTFVAVAFIGYFSPPAYSQDAIFCNGFENCPAVDPTLEALEARIAALEAESAAKTTFVLFDSDSPPKPVGEVVSILEPDTVMIKLPFGDKEAFLKVVRGQLDSWTWLLFESDDCSGQAYAYEENRPIRSYLTAAVIVYWSVDIDTGVYRLYFRESQDPDDSKILTDVFYQGTEYQDGVGDVVTCNSFYLNKRVYPVSLAIDDIYGLYPQPFTLVEQ